MRTRGEVMLQADTEYFSGQRDGDLSAMRIQLWQLWKMRGTYELTIRNMPSHESSMKSRSCPLPARQRSKREVSSRWIGNEEVKGS